MMIMMMISYHLSRACYVPGTVPSVLIVSFPLNGIDADGQSVVNVWEERGVSEDFGSGGAVLGLDFSP